MYLKLNNGVIEKYPYSYGQLQADNPQTSFPASPNNERLAEWEVFPVEPAQQPAHNELTTVLVEKQPVNDNGWKQVWEVQNLPQAQAEANVRSKRDSLLTECDWVVIKSVEVVTPEFQEWKDYRQALRDVPQQAGFPWNVTWPAKP